MCGFVTISPVLPVVQYVPCCRTNWHLFAARKMSLYPVPVLALTAFAAGDSAGISAGTRAVKFWRKSGRTEFFALTRRSPYHETIEIRTGGGIGAGCGLTGGGGGGVNSYPMKSGIILDYKKWGKAMKRKISTVFKKTRREMIEKKIKCHECEDNATELHHIIAIEDGGTYDIENFMPLCKKCHKEYTSEQIIERNKLWTELRIDDDGEVTARCSYERDVEHLGNIRFAEFKAPSVDSEGGTTTAVPVHYEYEWIVTVEIPAMSARESKEKLNKFKYELFERYAHTDDIWLTGIRRWNGKK